MTYKLCHLVLAGSIFSLIAGTVFSADTYQVDTAHSFIKLQGKASRLQLCGRAI